MSLPSSSTTRMCGPATSRMMRAPTVVPADADVAEAAQVTQRHASCLVPWLGHGAGMLLSCPDLRRPKSRSGSRSA